METKNCPYCGEEIMADAVKCRHCGEWLNEEPMPHQELVQETNKKSVSEQTVEKKKQKSKKAKIVAVAIVAVVALIIGTLLLAGDESTDLSPTDKNEIEKQLTKAFAECRAEDIWTEELKELWRGAHEAAQDFGTEWTFSPEELSYSIGCANIEITKMCLLDNGNVLVCMDMDDELSKWNLSLVMTADKASKGKTRWLIEDVGYPHSYKKDMEDMYYTIYSPY